MSLISGEKFTNLCDVAIYTKRYLMMYSNIARRCNEIIFANDPIRPLQKAIINKSFSFFVKTDHLQFFKYNIMPLIRKKFILITHNSDHIVGNDYLILNNPYLLKWFGQNMIPHEKNIGIPLGIQNNICPYEQCLKLFNKHKNNEKEKLLYINFSLHTNPTRKKILEIFKKKKFPANKQKKWEEYINDLSKYKYCISPPGNGPDCHRIWECIYLNCIPIVKKDPILFTHFKELPILWVNDYNEIDGDFLEKKYDSFSKKKLQQSNIRFWDKIFHNLKFVFF